MRQIILDTETTGIGPESGHRIIEIGCVEMIDRQFTGRHYHVYLNPEREVDEGAFRVHGISFEFLQDKPLFAEIVAEFMAFIQGAELIIHNAPFDLGFLNHELKLLQRKETIQQHCKIFDTLDFARKKHPGQKNNLDALCKRYEIDNSNRQLHGALLDAEILGWVYLAMTGGQASLFAQEEQVNSSQAVTEARIQADKPHEGVVIRVEAEEAARHQAFIALLEKKSGKNLWAEN